jgi:putative DNA primase/helicase
LQRRFAIASSDYTSGTERRRIGVRFDQQVERKDQQILLDFRTNGEMFGEFAGYIPGLLNWVLSMGEVRAKELLKNHCEASQLLCQQKATMLTETNPLAAWADEELVQETGYRNYVGIAQQIRFTTGDMGQSESWTAYRNANTWLYPNYCQYAQNTGTNPLSQKRFTSLLLDLLQAQLKLPISKGTDRKGSYFEGIRIRTGSDDNISTLITKLSELEPNNSDLNTESEKCDGSCDGSVMDNVMARPILQQACDGCDGKIDNYSIENENIKNTLSMNTGTALQENLAFDPSQPITQVVIEVSETTAVIEVEATVMGDSVPSQLQEFQQSEELANTETQKAEEFLVLSEVEVINIEAVIAERNKKFPIGSYVYYKDSRFKGFGNLESKTLAQVTNHFDWCPEHIQVKGKAVEGIVACADCKPLTRYEELKLGLSRK